MKKQTVHAALHSMEYSVNAVAADALRSSTHDELSEPHVCHQHTRRS
jgi:hypothetical protein